MIDLNDFIVKTARNGNRKRFFKAYCDKCGSDRGYKRKIKADSVCRSCAQKHTVTDFPDHVTKDNFITVPAPTKSSPNRKSYLYQAKCPNCNKDKGYSRPKDFMKPCLSCAAKKRHSNMPVEVKHLSKIKASCTQRNIEVDQFDNFSTKDSEKERNKIKASMLREQCFKRDKYTCKKCSKTGVELNAHHLNSFDIFPKQRFELHNLLTLCKDCHVEFHDTYGRGKNTVEQWSEFNPRRIVYLLTGSPASGKSWVCNQLPNNLDIIDMDLIKRSELSTHVSTASNPVISMTIGVSTFIKRNPTLDVRLIVIKESVSTIRQRLQQRGGQWTETIERRMKRMESLSKKAVFCGTSSEVLAYLKSSKLF